MSCMIKVVREKQSVWCTVFQACSCFPSNSTVVFVSITSSCMPPFLRREQGISTFSPWIWHNIHQSIHSLYNPDKTVSVLLEDSTHVTWSFVWVCAYPWNGSDIEQTDQVCALSCTLKRLWTSHTFLLNNRILADIMLQTKSLSYADLMLY